MRHGRKYRKLNFYSGQRQSVLRTLTVSLLLEESITTTEARAKEIKREAEKVITFCKDDSLASKRRAFAYLRSKQALQKLYSSLKDRYAEKDGGYIRLFHVGYRRGDGAPMAMLKLS